MPTTANIKKDSQQVEVFLNTQRRMLESEAFQEVSNSKQKRIKFKINPHTEDFEYWGARIENTFYEFDILESENLSEKEIDFITENYLFDSSDIQSEYELENDEIEEMLKGGKK